MSEYPVRYWVDYPETSSRGILLLKTFLGSIIMIPHFFIVYFLAIAYGFVSFIAWWAILFTGKWPEGMFNFAVKFNRYSQWISAYYPMLLVDRYPPFFGDAEPGADYPVHLEIPYPESSSRGILLLRSFFGMIYVMIPHGFCLAFLGIAMMFVLFIAWWAILFTGKWPEGMFNFIVGVNRWSVRVTAYMAMLTDEYPPFGLD